MISGINEELKNKILNSLHISYPKPVDFNEHKYIFDQDEGNLILILDDLEKKNYIEKQSYVIGADTTFSLGKLQLTPEGKKSLAD